MLSSIFSLLYQAQKIVLVVACEISIPRNLLKYYELPSFWTRSVKSSGTFSLLFNNYVKGMNCMIDSVINPNLLHNKSLARSIYIQSIVFFSYSIFQKVTKMTRRQKKQRYTRWNHLECKGCARFLIGTSPFSLVEPCVPFLFSWDSPNESLISEGIIFLG